MPASSASARRRAATVAAAVLAAAAGAGCGEPSPSARESIRATLNAMHDDLVAGRYAAVCAAMTVRPRRQVGSVGHRREPTTCPRDLRRLVASSRRSSSPFGEALRGLGEGPAPSVVAVALDPDGRSASVIGALDGSRYRQPFELEDGEWKAADFFNATGPTPRPLR